MDHFYPGVEGYLDHLVQQDWEKSEQTEEEERRRPVTPSLRDEYMKSFNAISDWEVRWEKLGYPWRYNDHLEQDLKEGTIWIRLIRAHAFERQSGGRTFTEEPKQQHLLDAP